MATTAQLYDRDFVRWTEEQAQALRLAAGAGSNLPLDWEHLAEEVESLGISYRRELRSRIGLIIEHLLKLEHSPAIEPRRGWTDTVLRERAEVELLVSENPSLREKLAETVRGEFERRKRLTLKLLAQHDEADPAIRAAISATNYTVEQVLGDWLPPG